MLIKKEHIVAKRNVLNELRANSMTLQELRFFSIYLSKINPNNISTRLVRFPLSDFQKIMDFDSRLKIGYLQSVTNSLLSKVVNIPLDDKGYTSFQLFKKCTVRTDELGEWYVEIDAHDEALPLMFEFKNRYFTYQLWNALRLKSSNQLRMYEILKQYEKAGERIISIDELKALLGINKKDYKLFNNFKVRVLDGCQEALGKHTDIKFTYEPTGKKGKGGKILYLKFIIKKNNNYTDQLTLDEFINREPVIDSFSIELSKIEERFILLSNACNNEFSNSEIQILYNISNQILTYEDFSNDITLFHFFKNKYDELKWRSNQTKVHKPFNYLKSLFEAELNQ